MENIAGAEIEMTIFETEKDFCLKADVLNEEKTREFCRVHGYPEDMIGATCEWTDFFGRIYLGKSEEAACRAANRYVSSNLCDGQNVCIGAHGVEGSD